MKNEKTKKRNKKKNAASIRLYSIEYSEHPNTDKQWSLENTVFSDLNLLVGKNAAGKSRIVNVISNLAKTLTGELPRPLNGHYKIYLAKGENFKEYFYEILVKDRNIVKEVLLHNKKKLLDRGRNGVGKIYNNSLKKLVRFEAPSDQLAAKNRRDTIQHPFFEDLFTWASELRHYQFSTPLGKDMLFTVDTLLSKSKSIQEHQVKDGAQVGLLYYLMHTKFGKTFDDHVLKDLSSLGYNCKEVGAMAIETNGGPPAMGLFLHERDINRKVDQITISNGMFRALSLVIQLNYFIFSKKPRTILIDDIGEGLDFSRSKAFIALLMAKAKKNNLQLIMTSNDRFVMNGVPLEHWGIVQRKKNHVKVINMHNSKNVFKEYESTGLNNFDFFSTNFFEEGLK